MREADVQPVTRNTREGNHSTVLVDNPSGRETEGYTFFKINIFVDCDLVVSRSNTTSL
jgi:hypothetical protein